MLDCLPLIGWGVNNRGVLNNLFTNDFRKISGITTRSGEMNLHFQSDPLEKMCKPSLVRGISW